MSISLVLFLSGSPGNASTLTRLRHSVPAPPASNIPVRVPTHFMGRDDALAGIETALRRRVASVRTVRRQSVLDLQEGPF